MEVISLVVSILCSHPKTSPQSPKGDNPGTARQGKCKEHREINREAREEHKDFKGLP